LRRAAGIFYADRVEPLAGFANVSGHLERLKARPLATRVLGADL